MRTLETPSQIAAWFHAAVHEGWVHEAAGFLRAFEDGMHRAGERSLLAQIDALIMAKAYDVAVKSEKYDAAVRLIILAKAINFGSVEDPDYRLAEDLPVDAHGFAVPNSPIKILCDPQIGRAVFSAGEADTTGFIHEREKWLAKIPAAQKTAEIKRVMAGLHDHMAGYGRTVGMQSVCAWKTLDSVLRPLI